MTRGDRRPWLHSSKAAVRGDTDNVTSAPTPLANTDVVRDGPVLGIERPAPRQASLPTPVDAGGDHDQEGGEAFSAETGSSQTGSEGTIAAYAGGVGKTSAQTARATDRPGDVSPFALGLLLRRAHDRASNALVDAVRPLGLELRHFAVMIELAHNGPTNQRDLGLATGMEKAMIVRVVDDLERNGLAERQLIPGDRRMRNVQITPDGLEKFDTAHENGRAISEELVAHLGPGEYATLMDILTRFTYPPAAER
jgi:DNA-binding MarR family transcriptional regulator